MMLNGKGGENRMTVKKLCQQMFENYLKDCGLDPMYRNGDAYASFLITADRKGV